MRVFVTRAYQQGEESGDIGAYSTLDAAQRHLEESVPPRERIVWKNPYPDKWFARIGHVAEGTALYVDVLDVLD